jgi:hypothetical protein
MNINDTMGGGDRIMPGSVERPPVMTVNSRGTLPQRETPVASAFAGLEEAVEAHRDTNRFADADYEAGYTSELGYQKQRQSVRDSTASRLVDLAENVAQRRADEADAQYRNLLTGMRKTGNVDTELRNNRFADRVDRELGHYEGTAKIRIARDILSAAAANPDELSTAIEILPSHFPGQDVSWMEADLRTINPRLASAAKIRQKAEQSRQMVQWAAASVRKGFETGDPATQVSYLAKVVSKYDPDRAH